MYLIWFIKTWLRKHTIWQTWNILIILLQGLVSELKGSDYDKLKQIFNNTEGTADEQKRIKMAFVEGYESGLQRQTRGRTMWLKIMQYMITVSAIIVVIGLYRKGIKIDANFIVSKSVSHFHWIIYVVQSAIQEEEYSNFPWVIELKLIPRTLMSLLMMLRG